MALLTCHHHLVSNLIVLIILLNVTLIKCHGHSHDDNHDHLHHHYHHNEEDIMDGKPSFKYSREANQRFNDLNEKDGHSHGHDDSHYHHDAGVTKGPVKSSESLNTKELPIKRKPSEIWLGALSSTLFISGVPFFILRFIPLDNSAEYQPFLKRLLSFAAGGLLGDAFLHLIPHALIAQQAASQHKDDHGHDYHHHHHHGHSHGSGEESHEHDMTVGLWVLAGVLAFLVVEKFVRIMKGPEHGHSHGFHGQTVIKSESKSVQEKKKKKSKEDKEEDRQKMIPGNDDSNKEDDLIDEPVDPDKVPKDEVKLKHVKRTKEKSDPSDVSPGSGKKVRFVGVDKIVPPEPEPIEDIKVAGYLNLAADFAHNLTDGLAIGASYIAGQGIGIMTTITILFHEIPHEIGDFAILVQSGCSRKKAMFLQLITALGAVTGTLISLVADGMSETASPWILPFTAGGFIYIACVSVIPELLEETNLKQSIWEIFAAAVGVGIMVFIAQFE